MTDFDSVLVPVLLCYYTTIDFFLSKTDFFPLLVLQEFSLGWLRPMHPEIPKEREEKPNSARPRPDNVTEVLIRYIPAPFATSSIDGGCRY
jgi:hypothetical protein